MRRLTCLNIRGLIQSDWPLSSTRGNVLHRGIIHVWLYYQLLLIYADFTTFFRVVSPYYSSIALNGETALARDENSDALRSPVSMPTIPNIKVPNVSIRKTLLSGIPSGFHYSHCVAPLKIISKAKPYKYSTFFSGSLKMSVRYSEIILHWQSITQVHMFMRWPF